LSTKIAAIRTLKVGRHIVIDGEPCKIMSYHTAKTGKHGSAKARIDAIGILDDKKRSLVKPVDAKIEVPLIERKNAQVNYKSGNMMGLMDLETFETFEATIPKDMEGDVIEGGEIEYIAAMDRKKIVKVR